VAKTEDTDMQSEKLPTLVRFEDLRQRGIVNSWAALKHMQQTAGFPKGRLIGPNTRAWTDEEVAQWWNTRPVEPSEQARQRVQRSIEARAARGTT
jgi:hypothetical protein